MPQEPRALDPTLSACDRFGAALRSWRQHNGLSQAQLALILPVTRDQIAKYEKADRWPDSKGAKRLDEFLGAGGELVALWTDGDAERAAAHGKKAPPDPSYVAHWTRMLSALAAAGNAVGGRGLMDIVSTEVSIISNHGASATGSVAAAFLGTQARWLEFGGWTRDYSGLTWHWLTPWRGPTTTASSRRGSPYAWARKQARNAPCESSRRSSNVVPWEPLAITSWSTSGHRPGVRVEAEPMDIVTTATGAEVAAAAPRVAILPIGSFEQHGDHLPLSTDTLIACGIAEAVAGEYGLFVLPPVTIACSHEHSGWVGTVSISAATLHRVVNDIIDSLRRSGISKVVLVNGHGGNYVLANIVQELSVDGPNLALFPGRDDWARARANAGLVTDAHEDMHAGEIETSLLLHLMPGVVRASYSSADHDRSDRRTHLLTLGVKGYTETGVIGKPSLADASKGKLVLESLTQSFQDYLRVLSA